MGLWEKSTALLLAERDCASLFVHAFNDSEGFQMDACFAQLIAAGLEAFFNYDARTKVAPEDSTRAARPSSALPFAKKSSISRTLSLGERNSLDTMMS